MHRVTEEHHGRRADSAESQGNFPDLGEQRSRKASHVILGFCAVAMLIDLLPPLAVMSGLYDRAFFLNAWIVVPGLPLNVATLVLFPLGIHLARRAASGAVLNGLSFEIVRATVVLLNIKGLTYWVINLSGGRNIHVTFFIAAFAICATALWLWRRAKAAGTTYRPVYFLLALLCGIILTEFAMY